MTMLFRLVLALFLAMSALPGAAPAACHEGNGITADSMAMHHRPAPRPDAAVAHGCIGCVPPSDWLRAPDVAAAPASRPLLVARATRLELGRGTPPALPPPRLS